MKIHHLTSIIALAALSALTFTPAAAAGGKLTEEARLITSYAYHSSVHEAKADYNLALALANNLATKGERNAAKADAIETYREDLDLAREQLNERRELAIALAERRYRPVIDPANFLSPAETAANPNPYLPLVPGTTRHYRGETDEGVETVEVTVTHDTRTILGVTCIVVRDIVRLDGALVEDTLDWFAQDRAGNVWYLGERVADYDADGLIVSVDGSFEAGVDGAQAGIVMLAQPTAGKVYRLEYFLGEAEDAAEVLDLDAIADVPKGAFTNCLKTEDFTPLEPEASEHKYYAPGVGLVLEENVESGKRLELISIVNN